MTASQPDRNATSETDSTALAPDAVFRIERWSASSGNDRPSRASLVLAGGDRRWHAHATGNGAVDALMRAVDQAVARVLRQPLELLTYSVHATGSGHAAAAAVTVSLREASADPGAPAYLGRATHANVLEASVAAYVDAINGLVVNRRIDVAAAAPLMRGAERQAAGEDADSRSHAVKGLLDAYNR
jgi:hypothetical protein